MYKCVQLHDHATKPSSCVYLSCRMTSGPKFIPCVLLCPLSNVDWQDSVWHCLGSPAARWLCMFPWHAASCCEAGCWALWLADKVGCVAHADAHLHNSIKGAVSKALA